ncbi:MAG: hypothetical protein JNK47_10910 [Mesorhizobium sp.]|nr:hypothetical protein [Mesorhizobium sp.]MBL8577728.1 hypothetical protein [Mesorhizobium sp.]
MTRDHLLPVVRPGTLRGTALYVRTNFAGAARLEREEVIVLRGRWHRKKDGTPLADRDPLPDGIAMTDGHVESRGGTGWWNGLLSFCRDHGIEARS